MVAAVSQPEQVPTKQDQALAKEAHPDTIDTSPGTPPAERPTLSPPPPDTPIEGTTPTSTSSDDAQHHNETIKSSTASAPSSQQTDSSKPAKEASLNAHAPAFVPNVAAAPFVPAFPAVNIHRHQNGAAGQMLNGHSPTASNTASPHAAWEEAGYGDAAAYGNGYKGYEGYGGYTSGYANYGYNAGYCMTSDGLFVPQQVRHERFQACIIAVCCHQYCLMSCSKSNPTNMCLWCLPSMACEKAGSKYI